jgi:quercetin dioxygenase-like cupin family protein
MKVMKTVEVPKVDATKSPIFYGGEVSRQDFVNDKSSKFFNFAVVNFSAGAKNKFHTHSSDQILYVTSGKGIVASEKREHVVTQGTTIHIPAGEKHWHGATDDSDFSHITITAVGSVTKVID